MEGLYIYIFVFLAFIFWVIIQLLRIKCKDRKQRRIILKNTLSLINTNDDTKSYFINLNERYLKSLDLVSLSDIEFKVSQKYRIILEYKFSPKWIYDNLIQEKVFLGMTKDMLFLVKGIPDKIEKNFDVSNVKETWVYGNKISGDYFKFEDDILKSFTDR